MEVAQGTAEWEVNKLTNATQQSFVSVEAKDTLAEYTCKEGSRNTNKSVEGDERWLKAGKKIRIFQERDNPFCKLHAPPTAPDARPAKMPSLLAVYRVGSVSVSHEFPEMYKLAEHLTERFPLAVGAMMITTYPQTLSHRLLLESDLF